MRPTRAAIVLTAASLASLALPKFEDRCQFSNYQSERLLLCTKGVTQCVSRVCLRQPSLVPANCMGRSTKCELHGRSHENKNWELTFSLSINQSLKVHI